MNKKAAIKAKAKPPKAPKLVSKKKFNITIEHFSNKTHTITCDPDPALTLLESLGLLEQVKHIMQKGSQSV